MENIAELDGKTLIIRLPLQKPGPSKSLGTKASNENARFRSVSKQIRVGVTTSEKERIKMNRLKNRTHQVALSEHADPVIPVMTLFEVIGAHWGSESPFRPNKMLVEAVLEVVGLVTELRGLEFWNSLKFGPRIPSGWVEDAPTRDMQRQMLSAHTLEFRRRSVSDAHIYNTLNFAEEVADRMAFEFSLGLMARDAPIPDEIRFKCAALIPVLRQQFTEVWSQIRDNTGNQTKKKRRAVRRGN